MPGPPVVSPLPSRKQVQVQCKPASFNSDGILALGFITEEKPDKLGVV